MTALEPCPFCGGAPVVDGKSDDVRVRCLDCSALGPSFCFDADDYDAIEKAEADAVAAWNTRKEIP